MTNWELGLLIAGLTVLMTVFMYLVCRTTLQVEEILPRWAKQNGYRIIRQELRTTFQGPFSTNRYRPVYYMTVEDRQGTQKKGWIRLGWWYFIGFVEDIEVCWEE